MEELSPGSLLLSAPAKFSRLRTGLALFILVGALAFFCLAWTSYSAGKHFFVLQVLQAVLYIVLAFVLVMPRTVKFFEHGVFFPRIVGQRRFRTLFLPWGEVERYYWVGDVLYLSAAAVVHTSTPLPRIRPAIESILERYVAHPPAA